MFSFHAFARRAPALALALALLVPALAPPVPALADDPIVRDHRDSTTRIQVLVKRMIIHDDLDWGDGEISTSVRVRTHTETCPSNFPSSCGRPMVETTLPELAATDGSVEQLDRVVPAAGDSIVDAETSPDLGIPVHNGKWYGLIIEAVERDPVEDDILGRLTANIVGEDGQIRFGAHTERGMGRCHKVPGRVEFCEFGVPAAFSVEYEIRRTPLPDLQPTAFRVAFDTPGDRDDVVCFTIQNRGLKPSAPFRVTIGIEGATPLVPDIGVAGLGAGETREQCTGGRLPDSGLHRLSVVVDGADTVPEMDERNNDLAVGLDRTPAGQTRAPGGPGVATTDTGDSTQSGGGPTIAGPATAPTGSTIGIRSTQPDLTVDAVRVNGQVPDGKSDCKDGKNTVSVVVKNAGMARAGSFTVRLEVDGGQAIEMDVPGLEATQEHEARFDDVRLKKGEHRLTVTVDSKNTVAEANEDNNVRTVTATCQNAG